jgi:hypothetical protein
MGKALNVPWKEIREACEKGTSQQEVAKLFNISPHTIRMRSSREHWNTPQRLANKIQKVTRAHENRVAENSSLSEQLNEGVLVPGPGASSTTDLETLSKSYRERAADKFFKIFSQSVIAPPRNWKDMKILDDLTRRALGLDTEESKASTIVQLQVVNDRLRASQDDIVEGLMVEECVTEASPTPVLQRGAPGTQPGSDSDDDPDATGPGCV